MNELTGSWRPEFEIQIHFHTYSRHTIVIPNNFVNQGMLIILDKTKS